MTDPRLPPDLAAVFGDLQRQIDTIGRALQKPAPTVNPWPVEALEVLPFQTVAGDGATHGPWATDPVSRTGQDGYRIFVQMVVEPASSTTAATVNVWRSATAPGVIITDRLLGTVSVPGNSGSKVVSGVLDVPARSLVTPSSKVRIRFELATPNTGVSWKAYKAYVRVADSDEADTTPGLTAV